MWRSGTFVPIVKVKPVVRATVQYVRPVYCNSRTGE